MEGSRERVRVKAMVIREVSLDNVCGITSTLPDNELTEIAFAGKSNVGKSSLINTLMNRKNLARTSSEPGKTQTINFYKIDAFHRDINEAGEEEKKECPLFFVDLPGYGYAKVSKNEAAKWGKMIENYLHTSRRLKAVFLLIDIRHEPGANDRQMYEWIISQGYKPIIIATKYDKIKRSQKDKQIKAIRVGLGADTSLQVIAFSAETKQGREDIYRTILKLEGIIDEI